MHIFCSMLARIMLAQTLVVPGVLVVLVVPVVLVVLVVVVVLVVQDAPDI